MILRTAAHVVDDALHSVPVALIWTLTAAIGALAACVFAVNAAMRSDLQGLPSDTDLAFFAALLGLLGLYQLLAVCYFVALFFPLHLRAHTVLSFAGLFSFIGCTVIAHTIYALSWAFVPTMSMLSAPLTERVLHVGFDGMYGFACLLIGYQIVRQNEWAHRFVMATMLLPIFMYVTHAIAPQSDHNDFLTLLLSAGALPLFGAAALLLWRTTPQELDCLLEERAEMAPKASP